MVAEGVDGVVGFLRPFVMFAVVRKGDAAFARDLIGALAAAATAAANPDAAVPVLKLLGESLLHFGRRDGEVCVLMCTLIDVSSHFSGNAARNLGHINNSSVVLHFVLVRAGVQAIVAVIVFLFLWMLMSLCSRDKYIEYIAGKTMKFV